MKINKNKLYRVLFVLGMTALAVLLVYFAFLEIVPELIPLLKNGDEAQIETYLRENNTVKGVLCTALLQMVQVWSVFISGVPIQVAAGIVYGIAGGFAICMFSSILAHYAALLLWRRMGKRMKDWMPVDDEKESRLLAYIKRDTPMVFVVVLACLVPVMPNGVIPIVAAKSDISVKDYLLAILGGTAVNILLCCAVGKQLILGNWLAAALCFIVLLVLVVLLWIYREPFLERLISIRKNVRAHHSLKKRRGSLTAE